MPKKDESNIEVQRDMPPASTPEAREQQLIARAYDLVETRLKNGTATSQETTHFLKLGSVKSQLELEKIRLESEMLKAKTEALNAEKDREKAYLEALNAMKRYSGNGDL